MNFYQNMVQPFIDFEFMRNALFACLLLSFGSAPLGNFMHLRRLGLAGDAISHGILPGLALGYLFAGFSFIALLVGGVAAGLVLLGMTQLLRRWTSFKEDSILSLLYLSALSSGIILLSLKRTQIDLTHFLFGSALSVESETLKGILIFSAVSFILLLLLRKKLFFVFFDRDFAFLMGLKTERMLGIYYFLFILQIVVGFSLLGSLLSIAIIVMPSLVARLLIRNFAGGYFLSILISAVASVLGLLWSYHADIPTGPAIVTCLFLLFITALAYHYIRSWVYREESV